MHAPENMPASIVSLRATVADLAAAGFAGWRLPLRCRASDSLACAGFPQHGVFSPVLFALAAALARPAAMPGRSGVKIGVAGIMPLYTLPANRLTIAGCCRTSRV